MKKLFLLALLFFNIQAAQAATLTVYPDAGTGSTTVDGYAHRTGVNEVFSTIRGGAGNGSADTGSQDVQPALAASVTLDQFSTLRRGIAHFDTSSLGAGATISSAVLSLYLQVASTANALGNMTVHIASATTAANNDIVNADYSARGTTTFANIAQASLSTSAYNDFTLNASGITNVSLTGISKFSVQSDWDINNSFTGTWVISSSTFVAFSAADIAGTTEDPKLVVTYTAAPASSHRGIIFMQ